MATVRSVPNKTLQGRRCRDPGQTGTVNHATFVPAAHATAVDVIVNFNVGITLKTAVVGIEMNRNEIFSWGSAVVLFGSVWALREEDVEVCSLGVRIKPDKASVRKTGMFFWSPKSDPGS